MFNQCLVNPVLVTRVKVGMFFCTIGEKEQSLIFTFHYGVTTPNNP